MPSSVIRAYSYDAAESRLIIEFTSGETYSYFKVPEAVVAGLHQAMSKGRYFQRHIRDRFDYRRERHRVS
ncbi:MAG TPA: KTSC domain-containing protein [Sphingobium sp.]|nr:KTSC domain-containing protein [Sphingobium sp.]